jgi:thiosulfate reductase cytochrome b subunit
VSSIAVSNEQTSSPPDKLTRPAWVRSMHWINAVAVVLMMMSGWQLNNVAPLFPFSFPKSIALGGWLGGALQWARTDQTAKLDA